MNGPQPITSPHWPAFMSLLHQHGQWFTPTTYPATDNGHCYANALRLATRRRLRYVEGVAFRNDECSPHAWAARGTEAIDPTWDNAHAYLGIPFTVRFARRRISQTGTAVLYDSTGNPDVAFLQSLADG